MNACLLTSKSMESMNVFSPFIPENFSFNLKDRLLVGFYDEGKVCGAAAVNVESFYVEIVWLHSLLEKRAICIMALTEFLKNAADGSRLEYIFSVQQGTALEMEIWDDDMVLAGYLPAAERNTSYHAKLEDIAVRRNLGKNHEIVRGTDIIASKLTKFCFSQGMAKEDAAALNLEASWVVVRNDTIEDAVLVSGTETTGLQVRWLYILGNHIELASSLITICVSDAKQKYGKDTRVTVSALNDSSERLLEHLGFQKIDQEVHSFIFYF